VYTTILSYINNFYNHIKKESKEAELYNFITCDDFLRAIEEINFE